jgi:hypothetical protein
MHERDFAAVQKRPDPLAIFAAIAFAVSVLLIGYLVFFAGGDTGAPTPVDETPPAATEPLVPTQ